MTSDWTDRVLAQALEAAGGIYAAEESLGRLLWTSPDGARCYERGDTLTIVRGGQTVLEYAVPGVDLADAV